MPRITMAQVAAAVPVVAGIVAMADNWPAVKVLLVDVGKYMSTPLAEAMWQSMAISVCIGLVLPHLPQQIGMRSEWSGAKTKARIRFWACLLAIAMCWARVPTPRGMWYALTCGLAAMGLWTTLAGWLYRIWPCARPESLKPNAADAPEQGGPDAPQ
ncbi:hypothetical protein EA658_09865 [Pseudoxanthomonas winnipegensis]|uniref:Uncharacterized protein n=1 Tax=Pseudoxanthomonas winnipegensis TaxID=2480810 RepID=A0ABY1WCQ8_9GAMM|nr:hypothetical protein [Pseudoxanthomonas winnipegensis]TAA12459.1 hypothetical protein EA659_03785 [Pseudoxanthomonas winnipegensis]TAA19176.1 hypothetical protein EA658_09865 [Pseudoxanthomonas winnipegensis]TAH70437.1 hypothetical protein EA657_16930 [Pseudoxanthomonas winnipegensis]